MSQDFRGPKLPAALLGQVDNRPKNHAAKRARNHIPATRKDRRKTEREQKRQLNNQNGRRKPSYQDIEESQSDASEEHVEDEKPPPRKPSKQDAQEKDARAKPILKTSKARNEYQKSDQPTDQASKPPKPSRRERERLEADDDDISALEKKLGIKNKKTPKLSKEDGLDDLLGELDESEEESSHKRKRIDDEDWLKSKRSRISGRSSLDGEEQDGDTGESDDGADDLNSPDSDLLAEESKNTAVVGKGSDEGENFEGFESEASDRPPPPPKRKKENPYVAPTTSHGASAAKYVPPSRRGAVTDDAELEQRLRRQIQGLINRLSETNLPSIVSDIDKLYQANPRQYVTSNVIDVLLGLLSDRAALNDSFIVLHAGFITALYKISGQDFGAQVIEGSVERFDQYYSALDPSTEGTKETVNLVSLLSQLYNFQLISCDLIFDLIRLCLTTLTEHHTELLLRIVRSSGSQLRQDDPSSLKDIVLLLQRTISQTPKDDLSVRTRFMIDTITDLKNNRLKAGVAASALTAEQLSRMRKTLGTLNTRHSIKATEPLRLTLSDIRNADKRGKWWLVGTSWTGRGNEPASSTSHPAHPIKPNHSAKSANNNDGEPDLQALARANHMTTPIRRSIFLTLLTSSDYTDAHARLLKLHLTKAQELEIPKVILHCVATERGHNPYYGLVARRLAEGGAGKRWGKMWIFSGMGIVGGLCGEEGQEEGRSMREVVQQARFFGGLMANRVVGVGMLKPLDLDAADGGMAEVFVEVLLVSCFLGLKKGEVKGGVEGIFGTMGEIAGLGEQLRRVAKRLGKTDLVGDERERGKVVEGVEVMLGRTCLGKGNGD